MDFLLDPYILAIPSENGHQAEKFIENLKNWTEEIRTKRHKFWTSSLIVEALCQVGQYPFWNAIQEYISHTPDFLTAYDLFRSVEREIVSPPYIDDECQPYPYDYVLSDTVVIPKQIEERLNQDVANALRETLIYVAIAKELSENQVANQLFFGTSDISIENGDLISIETYLTNIESDEISEITSEWNIITSIKQLDEIMDLKNIWEDTERAIRWTYDYLCKSKEINQDTTPIPKIIIGAKFNFSIKDKYHIDNQPTVLSNLFTKTVKALVGIIPRGTKNHHELWESDETNAPQIIRRSDKATAWRLKITGGLQAYRLHYWLKPNGEVELSYIGTHDDYTIIP